jgi:mono/diheme cytochrome c family protein
VKQLGITPANFTDLGFMRGETPRDSFNAITLGRPKNGMPTWGDAFSAQQIWDLVAYVWSLSSPPGSAAAGERIYAAQCAGCHGPNGDPAESQAASLQRPSRSLAAILDRAEHSDADVFTVVSTGVAGTSMPASRRSSSRSSRSARRFATPRRAIPMRSGGSSAPTSTRPPHSSVPAAPRARRRRPGLARAWSSPPEPIYSGCTRAARFPRAARRPEPSRRRFP